MVWQPRSSLGPWDNLGHGKIVLSHFFSGGNILKFQQKTVWNSGSKFSCLLPQALAPNTFERVRKKSLYIQLSASEGSVWARRKETFERVGRKRLSASERAQAQARERRGHTTPPGHGGWSQLFLGFLPIDISTAGDIPSQDDGWGQEVHQDLNLPSREGLKVRRDLPKRTVDLTTVNLRMRKHGIILPTKRPKRKMFQYQFFLRFINVTLNG